MHIIHLASELAPIAKVGGLADVVYGLSKELVRQGHKVHIILPKYDSLRYDLIKDLKVFYRDLWSYDGPYRYNNTIWSCNIEGLSVFLLEPHHPHYFFHRGSIYGCPDDIERFLYFSRAAIEFLFKAGICPDVLHIHDWPTAIAPVLWQDMYLSLGMAKTRTVLTLHNLEHQGKCGPRHLSQIGLRGESYLNPDKMQDPINSHFINLLKGGIEYADMITTVSPSYKEEIQTPQGGHGLSGVLSKHQNKLKGILNGIDEDFWNPEKDPYLEAKFKAHAPFSSKDLETIAQKKQESKCLVQKNLGLSSKNSPLVVCISRLVAQKSPHLIAHAFSYSLSKGAQCVILGAVYSEDLYALFSSLQGVNPQEASIMFDYNEPLAHLLYAAADIIIIPSLFEPCGLTQLIALRYGTIPLVRSTGGLKDTVFDWDTSSVPLCQRNGFSFEALDKQEMEKSLDRAFALWKESPKKWTQIRKQGMEKDFSWKSSALKYVEIYKDPQKPPSEL